MKRNLNKIMFISKPLNKEDKQYLDHAVNCYLEPLLIEMLETAPADSLAFMRKWLNVRGEGIKNSLQQEELQYKDFKNKSKRDVEPPMPRVMEAKNPHEESASPKKPRQEREYSGNFHITPAVTDFQS